MSIIGVIHAYIHVHVHIYVHWRAQWVLLRHEVKHVHSVEGHVLLVHLLVLLLHLLLHHLLLHLLRIELLGLHRNPMVASTALASPFIARGCCRCWISAKVTYGVEALTSSHRHEVIFVHLCHLTFLEDQGSCLLWRSGLWRRSLLETLWVV